MQIYNGQRWTCDNFYFMRVRGGSPLPSDRHHRSNGDCLEGKRENYQSVLCNIVCNNCAQCTVNRPNSSLDWVLSNWGPFHCA